MKIKFDPALPTAGLALLAAFGPAAGGLQRGHGAIVLGLFTLAACLRIMRRGGLRLRPRLFLPALAALLSLAVAPIPGLGSEAVARLVFYAVIAAALPDLCDDRIFLRFLAAALLLLAGSILFTAAADHRLLGRAGLGLSRGGLLGGANAAGLLLALGATPFSLLLMNGGRRARLIIGGLFIPVILAAIALTGARTAFIALAGGLAVPFIRLPRRGRALAAGLFLLAVAALIAASPGRFRAWFDPDFPTNRQRIGMAKTVSAGFAARPFLGHGAGSYPVISARYQVWPKWELHPHALPLRVIFETGAIGAAAWLLFVLPLWRRRRALARHPAAFGVALAILAGSLTDDLLWIPIFPLLLCLGLAPLTAPLRALSRPCSIVLILAVGVAGALLPWLHTRLEGLPGEPLSRAIARTAAKEPMPDFTGWEEDPVALRIAAFRALESGDTRLALTRLRRVATIDPMMIWTPNRIDLAWLAERMADTAAAAAHLDEARRLAPVLVAWYRGETAAVAPSLLDRHHGIEFPDVFAVTLGTVPAGEDFRHWTHHRGRVARAILAGDTPAARRSLAVALSLAARQHGTDPLLCRLAAILQPEKEAVWLERARARSGPADLWRVFGPLLHRMPVTSRGDIAPWRMERRAKEASRD